MDLRDKLSSLDVPPGKVVKVVLAFSAVLLLIWLLTLSHIDYNQGPDTNRYVNPEQVVDTTNVSSDSSKSEIQPYEQSTGMFSSGLLTFFVLLIILIMVWLWVDRKKPTGTGGVERELGTESLGEGAQLKIIRINKEIWVLGVTSGSVNLLHRYDESEWTEKMREKDTGSGDMFRKLFRSQL